MIMAEECLEAEVVIVQIPKFDGEVGRTTCDVAALVVVVEVVHWI